jgi:predicted permease
MAIYEGRDFDEHDTAAGVPVAVVNRTFAERFFPGESPLGQKILVTPDEKVAREIIGVVGDLKSKELAAAAGAEMYVPLVQSPADSLTFVVRTESVPARSIAPIRAALQALDPAQAAYEVQTFDDVMRKALAEERFSMIVFAAFALLAVVLAAVGLYGVMSYVVSGRTREMGVRMALGARPVEVRRLVVRQALVLLGIGMVIGIPASIAATRLLGKLLYGVHPADPLTLLGVTAVIGAMTWLSTYLPARRATRVDPAVVLRGD